MSFTQFVHCNSLVEETNVVFIFLGRLYAQIHLPALSVATLKTRWKLLSMLPLIPRKMIGKSILGKVKKGRESYCDILRKGKSAKEEEDAPKFIETLSVDVKPLDREAA